MKRILVTGATGFVGRNVCPYLKNKYEAFCPNRKELNLLDAKEVRNYICENKIETVINLANPNPVKNALDKKENFFEDSIRIFMNLYEARDMYDMMYTLGSGAEFDKSEDIVLAKEDDLFRIPYDTYGLAKYTINRIIENDEKQCNLRIFGCFGPTDHESKFITHAIRCCMKSKDITIRQDCYFDYIHVYDLRNIFSYFIENKPRYRAYNVCSSKRVLLSEIAGIVKSEMNSSSNIVILNEGFNKEYTGSNQRLLDEIKGYEFITLEEGIKMQIESELKEA